MKTVFADAWFYLALLDAGDQGHRAATEYLRKFDGRIVTTRWVLVEVANGLAAPRFRAKVSALLAQLERNERIRILEDSDALYQSGRALYETRPDKEWSLTDCISFVVMEGESLREALTGDRHFAQAGFVAIFVESP